MSQENATDIITASFCENSFERICIRFQTEKAIVKSLYKIDFEENDGGTLISVMFDFEGSGHETPFIPPYVLNDYFAKRLDAEVILKKNRPQWRQR